MKEKHLDKNKLTEKTIDAHSHIGVSLSAYSRLEYPYAQTAEGIYYRQITSGVDINVVFPFTADLYFDFTNLLNGQMIPADTPISPSPYEIENLTVMREIFDFCPELSERFIPFISIDPVRDVNGQLRAIEKLARNYPIYGIKVNPVGCQSHAIKLLDTGKDFLEFARQNNIPFTFHTVAAPVDEYSQPTDILRIAERNPGIRFCLAHCIHFNKSLLKLANAIPNVWVDTAALKIQIDLVLKFLREDIVKRSDLIDTDYSDPKKVINTLVEMYPNLIIWGSDTPAYTFHCRRKQGENLYQEFNLKGRYEDEIDALNSLPDALRKKISNENTIKFLFG